MVINVFLLVSNLLLCLCLAKQEPAGHFVWHRRIKFGAHDRVVSGNEWSGKVIQHTQIPSDTVAREVESEAPYKDHIITVPQKIRGASEKALIHHFSKRARGPAPAPAPGPSPAPWSEDPQWMVDGARGNKDNTVPITNQFKGDQNIPLPEQGYHGKPIRHANGETMTGDFANEFGSAHKDAFEICMEKGNRNDFWCRTHLEGLMAGSEAGEAYAKAQGILRSKAPWATSNSALVLALVMFASVLIAH